MAHECPECGHTCFCGGDIDDIDFGQSMSCTCCDGCDEEDYEPLFPDEDEIADAFGYAKTKFTLRKLKQREDT